MTVRTIQGGEGAAQLAQAKLKAARAGEDTSPQAALAEHGEHAGEGDPNLQISAYKPGFRPADRKLAVRSGKEAFCLANTDAIDYTIPNHGLD
ncbi:hypothetical protein [Couchioplanes caeruleus]|uniref:Uncharacterized protein n=1 Tax=Couchioplanes caeruleus subsp. caeruleus TaxID=56427 RepID=A0A1K0FL86_9ACTN|nr:hypothetical protein [Couchioplanes caeruleus]OJF13569.1 hypothetical protein BG844_14425 [Couchioplanes caeruleus subsp. caeruleus]